MDLIGQLTEAARKDLGRPDPDAMLTVLFKARKTPAQIAQAFGVTDEAVRYHLRRLGLMPKGKTFEARVHEAGFKTISAFFKTCIGKGAALTELAKDLGMNPRTLGYHHTKWLKEQPN